MRIGILQTGHVPDTLRDDFPSYALMFERLLAGHGFTFAHWMAVDMDFPAGPADADGWLITGSRHGAYEDHPFIAPLEQLIRDIHAAQRPLVGICFGHQIIAQALGGTVEKAPAGWAVGPTTYSFDDRSVRLMAWHQDQVTQLPEGARVLGGNAFCPYGMLGYGDSILTVQAHPEFDPDFVTGLIDTRGRGVVPDAQLDRAKADLTDHIDKPYLATRIAAFFLAHQEAPNV